MSKYDKLKKLNVDNREKSELLFDAAKIASNEIRYGFIYVERFAIFSNFKKQP